MYSALMSGSESMNIFLVLLFCLKCFEFKVKNKIGQHANDAVSENCFQDLVTER